MKRIIERERVADMVAASPYRSLLEELNIPLFLAAYTVGEFISAPWSAAYCLGEMALFKPNDATVFAQAMTDVLCLAFSVTGNEEILLSNNQFLRLICRNMSDKLLAAAMCDAVSSSLSERVWNYIQFKCENGILKGLEKNAFQLHCSERQLQRIMNDFRSKGMVKKIGKGTYQREVGE